MSYLSSLTNSLSIYKESLEKAEKELLKQKKRLNDIKSILSALSRNFDDFASDITGYARKASDTILDGMKGSSNMVQRSEDAGKEYEKDPDSDSKLSFAKSNLMSERSVVENKITELEEQIASLKSHIATTESAIQAEERRLEEERREAARREEQRREEESKRAAASLK